MRGLVRITLLVTVLSAAGCGQEAADKTARITPPPYLALLNGRVYLERDDLRVTINPEVGGRIESLVYAGRERLVPAGDRENATSWGNVLWTSPQSDWGWPPPAALDSAPYRVELTAREVQLHGPVDPQLGVSVSKGYRLADDGNTLIIHYQIHNQSDTERTLAPWEVTRLPARGQVFFPKGETAYSSGQFAPLTFSEEAGIAWFRYDEQSLTEDHYKSMTDGEEGWLAYQADDWLFVKAFDNVPADLIAPGEGEIELYVKGDGSYMELEQQGYLTTLMPGETLDWHVLWSFASLPPGHLHPDGLVARARQLAGLALSSAD